MANAIVLETFLQLDRAEIQPPGYLWGNIIEQESLTVLHTGAKRAKSMWTLNLSIALAAGWESFLDVPVYGPARVVIFQREVHRFGIQTRMRKMFEHAPGTLDDEAKARIMHNASRAVRLYDMKSFTEFRSMLRDIRPALVVLDPLAHTLTDDENDNAKVGQAMERIMALRDDPGCAVLVVHHNRKESDMTRAVDPMQNARGADRIIADADAVLSLTRGRKHPLGPLSKFHITCRNSEGIEPFTAVFNKQTAWWERAHEKGDSELIASWCAAAPGGVLTFRELEVKMKDAWSMWDAKHHRAAFRALDRAVEAGVLERVGSGVNATYGKKGE